MQALELSRAEETASTISHHGVVTLLPTLQSDDVSGVSARPVNFIWSVEYLMFANFISWSIVSYCTKAKAHGHSLVILVENEVTPT
jgi:hypothetical protein